MAGFRTHITVSSALGVAYGGAGYFYADMPPGVCLLAGGLCSVSGMLPDLDSDSGVPLRESVAFASAVLPMLMIPRWRTLGLSPESMVLAGSLVYLAVRFGIGWLLKKYTVHRGMFHSLPAALLATEIAFLVYSRKDINLRYYVAAAVGAGFMSHLVLDEIWSVGVKRGQIALKKSFGTALKLWGHDTWGNISCYGKLLLVTFLVFQDPVWMYDGASPGESVIQLAQKLIDKVRGRSADEDPPPLQEIPRESDEARGFAARQDPYGRPPTEYYVPQYGQPQYVQPQYGNPRVVQPRYVPQYGQPQPQYQYPPPQDNGRWIYQR
jgi:membrane-bound metal-dependent hydrolase YbcI (DUF457 family)